MIPVSLLSVTAMSFFFLILKYIDESTEGIIAKLLERGAELPPTSSAER